jgi:hypothetical protein
MQIQADLDSVPHLDPKHFGSSGPVIISFGSGSSHLYSNTIQSTIILHTKLFRYKGLYTHCIYVYQVYIYEYRYRTIYVSWLTNGSY